MKFKLAIVLLSISLSMTCFYPVALRAEDDLEIGPNLHSMEYVFTIGKNKMSVLVDGDMVVDKDMDVSPYIKNDRTMLPIRWVAEALDMELEFDEPSRNIILKKDGQTFIINIDSKMATKGEEKFDFKDYLENVQDRIFLPLTKIASLFGVEAGSMEDDLPIRWDSKNKKVHVLLDN